MQPTAAGVSPGGMDSFSVQPIQRVPMLKEGERKNVWSKALAYSLLLMASDTSLDIVNSSFFVCILEKIMFIIQS